MNKFIFLCCFLLAGFAPLSEAGAAIFGASEFYLDNGLRVIVVPNRKAPIVKQMLWYKVGSVDEKPGQGGTAHLLEHLMFRGTKKVSHDTYNDVTQSNGMDGNAFTSQDFTAYHQSMDISRLELAMFLEADRMQNLDLSQENFELERDIVYQERKQVVENNPAAEFNENLRRLMWGEHPYARPITGTPEEIKNLKLDDVRDFYNQYYAPNNAILVLAGDIDAKTAKILAEKYYGGLKPKSAPKDIEWPELKSDKSTHMEMSLPRINSVRIINSWIAPSYAQEKNDIYALAVLSKYLGEGKTSRLYKSLVKEKKVALAVESSYDYGGRSYGSFSIFAIPQDGVSAKKLQEELDKALNQAINEINNQVIEKTKLKMRSGLVLLRDNPNDAAMIVGLMAAAGMSLEEIENYETNIEAVNADVVKRMAKVWLRPEAKVSGVIKPMEKKHD